MKVLKVLIHPYLRRHPFPTETTMTSGPYYSHSAPKYFFLGFISHALFVDFTTSLAIFFYSVKFSTVARLALPINSSASSFSVCSSCLLTGDGWTKGVDASTKLLDLVATLRVCLVAGQPGQGRPLASSLVSQILRDNWKQHWDSHVPTLDPEPNNLI